MQIKFIFDVVKSSLYFGIIVVLLAVSHFFSGCGGSEEVEITQREIDSIVIYTDLQKAFTSYKKGLTYNESSDNANAQESFEKSLKFLHQIKFELISKPENYFWKQDYDELAKSIVEDYLITQTEIPQNSLVFEFARKVSVTYEKVEEVSMDREPLPEGSDIPFVMNSAVEKYIEFFSNSERGRSFIDKSMYRSGKYFPLMRKILKFNNAPEELVYLSVQESGLSPTIVSRAGAVGLWQFMPATGMAYGLYQDGYRDDRRDFEKSTDAAARHLKDLYRTFDDWYLAFCAYNAGPGRVNSAIRKSGSRDFWSLRGYLPGETKNYVPSIIALSYVLRSPEKYGFKDLEFAEPISYDRVDIKTAISLQRVADLCDTDVETIRDLNPELMNDEIPEYDVAYELRIPYKSYDKFAANFKKASDLSGPSEFAGSEVSGGTGNVLASYYKVQNYSPENPKTIGSPNGKKKVFHDYDRGELLSAIAVYYDVRPTDIRIWNNLTYGSLLKSDQKLSVYLTESSYRKLYGKKNGTDENTGLVTENITDKKPERIKNSDGSRNYKRGEKSKITSTVAGVESDGVPYRTIAVIVVSDSETKNSNSKKTKVKESVKKTEGGITEEVTIEESVKEKDGKTTVTETFKESSTESSEGTTITEGYTETSKQTSEPVTDVSSTNTNSEKTETEVYEEEVIVKEPTKTSVPMTKPVTNKKSATASTYVVSSGDNLTMIADNFGVSVNELIKWNDLESDKILVGQKLKVVESSSGKNNNKKTSGASKTYKVKTGETLASISAANNISIQNLKKWNNLKTDKILIGQVLKLYDAGKKEKVSKKKK